MTLPNNTRLIQRLEKPAKSGIFAGKDNPFAFGGGLRNGGLSDDAMSLIREVFAFDYMGSAEYEFGAVPEGLTKVAKAAQDGLLTAKTIKITGVPVYIIARADQMDDVIDVIRADHKGGPQAPNLKQATRFWQAVSGNDDVASNCRICGWLELDNGFFYFTDEEMFKGVADLFEVEVA